MYVQFIRDIEEDALQKKFYKLDWWIFFSKARLEAFSLALHELTDYSPSTKRNHLIYLIQVSFQIIPISISLLLYFLLLFF